MDCVSAGCKNPGKHKGKTYDGHTIRVCEEHKSEFHEEIERAENVWYKRFSRWLYRR